MTRGSIFAAYAALAVASTWPLAASPASRLPLGTEPAVSVPVLNAWTVWWNADRARYGFTDYWHAPIFYPARYAFAFSEAQPTTLLVAPLVSLGGPPLAYNAYLLAVLTLNGLVAYRLLRRVGLAVIPAVLGGVMAETLPFVHWQLGVLQLATLCGVLWVLDRLVALRDGGGSGRAGEAGTERGQGHGFAPPVPEETFQSAGQGEAAPPPFSPPPRVRDALLLGVAAAACYAACNYWGLFLSALLPLALPPLVWGRWRNWRFWLLLAASGLLAAGLTSPILWAQWRAKTDYVWERPEPLLIDLSAQPRDYSTTPWRPAVPALDPVPLKDPSRPLWMLGPGLVKLGLGAAGVIAGLLVRGRRRWTLFLVLLAGWAFLLSLGPKLEVVDGWRPQLRADSHAPAAGRVPYSVFMKAHPGLSLARSPFRFAFFVQIAAALLAANLIDGIWGGVRRLARDWRTWPKRIGVGLVSAVTVATGVFAAVEVWPARQRLYAPPSPDQAWIGWLRENADPSRPILDLPFPAGSKVEHYERTALFMYEQIGHRRPMVQGYSGFFPDEFLALKDRMPSFPADELLDDLTSLGVRHVVATTPEWVARAGSSPRLRLAFRDEDAKVSVYSLLPSADAADDRGPTP